MAIPPHWPFEDEFSFRPTQDSTGGPIDQTARFSPEVGPEIVRRRITAKVEMWQLGVLFPTFERFAEFEAWHADTLLAGSLPFAWRHPSSRAVRRFQFSPGSYSSGYPGGEWVRVSFGAMILPGVPWFAPYVATDGTRVPDWVADYRNSRYWVNGVPVASTGLSAVTGDYLVLEQRLTLTRNWLTRTYDEDVPQTAPDAQVDFLAGFEL